MTDNYLSEMEAISSVKFHNVDEDFFFKEFTWVVHASGFSAKAVGKFFPKLLLAYGHWEELAERNFDEVMERMTPMCKNRQKAKAIHSMSVMMKKSLTESLSSGITFGIWWDTFKKDKLSSPELLAQLPYIGKVTCFHLARNLGLLEFVTPDLHLVRMAKHWGFPNPTSMCESIQKEHTRVTGEKMPLGIVDLVLWYSSSHFSTLSIRQPGDR